MSHGTNKLLWAGNWPGVAPPFCRTETISALPVVRPPRREKPAPLLGSCTCQCRLGNQPNQSIPWEAVQRDSEHEAPLGPHEGGTGGQTGALVDPLLGARLARSLANLL